MSAAKKDIWIFLSHSNEDYEKVRKVRNMLEDQELRPTSRPGIVNRTGGGRLSSPGIFGGMDQQPYQRHRHQETAHR